MTMPYPVLAVDCARGAGSLVLALSPTDWRGRVLPAGQSQASDLLPEAQALLAEAALTMQSLRGFVLGQGPGSFTGLRIAAGLVQGLARGLGVGSWAVAAGAVKVRAAISRGVRKERIAPPYVSEGPKRARSVSREYRCGPSTSNKRRMEVVVGFPIYEP